MNIRQKGLAAALVVASMGGGAIGATVLAPSASSAASNSGAAGTTGPSGPQSGALDGAPPAYAPGGKFVSNENPTHEQSESSQREAQETAGQFPTVR